MSRYLQFVLVLVYAVYSYCLFVICTGLDKQYTYLPLWLFYCFTGGWWFSPFYLLFSRARKPIWEEEQTIRACLNEVLSRVPGFYHVHLIIEPGETVALFATGVSTIGFSPKTLEILEPEELKAVLAHELGHLMTRDTLAIGAFQACGFLPQKLMQVCVLLRLFVLRYSALAVLPIVILSGAVIIYYGYGFLALRILLFVFVFIKLQFVFRLMQKMIGRYNEYRQDAFAHKLGYGLALKSALIKLMGENITAASPFENFLFGNHPITYNRIRRLEKLEGLRTDG